jgi:hypothetical protein
MGVPRPWIVTFCVACANTAALGDPRADAGAPVDLGAPDVRVVPGDVSLRCPPWPGVVDLRTTRIRGDVTVNGTARSHEVLFALARRGVPGAPAATVRARGGSLMGTTLAGDYTLRTVGGTTSAPPLPQNSGALVVPMVRVEGDEVRVRVALRSTRVRGRVTLDGATPRQGPSLVLRGGDDVGTVTTEATAGAFDVFVLPGRYEVAYTNAVFALARELPINQDHPVLSALDVAGDVMQRDVPLRTTTLRATVTSAGRAPVGELRYGLRGERGSTSDVLSTGGRFEARVFPGVYAFEYRGVSLGGDGAPLPRGGPFVLEQGIDLSTDVEHALALAPVRFSGRLSDRGAPVTGEIIAQRIVEGRAEARVIIPITRGAWSAWLLPGAYDLELRSNDTPTVLQNVGASLARGLSITADTTRDFALHSVAFSGEVRVNDAALGDGASLRLVSSTLGEVRATIVGGRFATRVLPGRYDLFYDGPSAGALEVPRNRAVVLARGVELTRDTPWSVALRAGRLRGTLTADGQRFAASNDAYRVRVVGDGLGEATLLSNDRDLDAALLVGSYDLYFTRLLDDDTALPVGGDLPIGCWSVTPLDRR